VTDGPVVVFTFDKAVHDRGWLLDYLPEMREVDTHHLTPEAIADALGGGRAEVVPVLHDCVDGFAHAYWRRPEAYLDPVVRAGISGIARLPDDVVASGISRLRADIASGRWATDHSDILCLDSIDAGFRLVIAE
jgi:hypothetical protein